MQSIHKQWALVTGASSGIGSDFAHALAERGANLVLAARRTEPMQRLAGALRSRYGVEVVVEGLDLALPGAAEMLARQLGARGIAVDILINNAGSGIIGEFLDQPLAGILAMLNLNMGGLTALTHLFARQMKARGGGHILLVGSIAAYQPNPLFAAYGATKAYVLSLGVALHEELAPHKVVVTVLSPGATETEFFDAAGKAPTAALRRLMMKSRPVADIGLAALFAGKAVAVPGLLNRIFTLTARLVSHLAAAKIAHRMARE